MIDLLKCPETKKVLTELSPELVNMGTTYYGESLRQVLLICSGMAGVPVDEELEKMLENLNGALIKAQEK